VIKRIPYAVIAAAKQGDTEAMNTILNNFEGYISYCSKRKLQGEYGNKSVYIDPDIRERIIEKLMLGIIYKFDLAKLPEGETLED